MENAPIRDDGSHITDEEVNLAVADGSGFEKGKLRIYRHFTEKKGNNAEFLKKEYGYGGRTWYYQNGENGWVGHSPAGLTLTMTCADGRFERKLKWKETAQRIAYLLEMQRYLTPEEEKEYPVWLAQQQEKQPPRAVVVPEVKPVCAEGSVVYLENGQPFTVENIGKFDVHLRDKNFPLISRAVSREQLQPLLDAEPRNGGMVLPEVPQIDRDSDQMKQALSYIADYLRNEFDITDADFSDLTQIDLGYTTTEDEQHTIQVCADLERCTISKLVDNTLYAQETFASLKAMNRDLLSSLEFDSLMEVDINEIEEREPTESPFVTEVMADVERLSAAAEPAEYDLTNYLAPYEPTVPKGAKEKFAANVAAIQTLKAVEQRGTPATEAEQDILAGYLGWGGLSDAFDPGKDNWHTEYEQLKTLLTEDEYTAARESTLTAFYTPPVSMLCTAPWSASAAWAAMCWNPVWVWARFSGIGTASSTPTTPNSTVLSWTVCRGVLPSSCTRKRESKSQGTKKQTCPTASLTLPSAMFRSGSIRSATDGMISCIFKSTIIFWQKPWISCAWAA